MQLTFTPTPSYFPTSGWNHCSDFGIFHSRACFYTSATYMRYTQNAVALNVLLFLHKDIKAYLLIFILLFFQHLLKSINVAHVALLLYSV